MAKDLDGAMAAALQPLAAIRLAWLFGSSATGRAGPMSDLDVAIVVDPHLPVDHRFGLRVRAGDALARAVSRDDLDVVILNEAPPLLCHEVLSTGRLLLNRDPELLVHLRVQTLRRYTDACRILETSRPYLVAQLARR